MRRDSIRRGVAFAVAALTCPCHLPLLAALLAGTALGAFIAGNLVMLVIAFAALFVGAIWLWSRESDAAPSARPPLRPLADDTASATSQTERLHVQILKTPGCASCAGVERSWEILQPEYDRRIHLEVADLLEQPELASRHGVLRTPAVVIDGRMRAQGALDSARLQRLLDEALRERGETAGTGGRAHA